MSLGKLILRLCVGAGMVLYLLHEHEVESARVITMMMQIPGVFVLGALALDLLGQSLSAYRWSEISALAGHNAGFARVFPVYFSGMFFNICLPTSIGGDVVRIVGLSRHTKSKSAAFASVFMDRNVGLAALLVIGFAASLSVKSTIEATFFHHLFRFDLWPMFLLLIIGYIGANATLFSDSFCDVVNAFLKRLRLGFVEPKLRRFHDAMQAYRMPLSAYFSTFVISFVYQLSEIAAVWLLARGLGIQVSPIVFAALVPFQAVACLLPISFNGVGVREAVFCAVLMGQAGEAIKPQALALSLVYFSVVVISGLFGGVVYLVSGMPRPTTAEAQAVAEAAGE